MVDGWIQIADIEGYSLSDFDVVTPAWDKEVDFIVDFDSKTDIHNHFRAWEGAAHDGLEGLLAEFSDAEPAYGTIAFDAIDQTSAVISLWFDPYDVQLEDGKFIDICQLYSGTTINTVIRFWKNGGVYQAQLAIQHDTGWAVSSTEDIVNDYGKFTMFVKYSTGADDGYVYLYYGDDLLTSITGIDNDAMDVDYGLFGIIGTDSTTFGGFMLMDSIKIDPVGGPMADMLAAMNGTYGMSIPVIDATVRYGAFTDPTAETAMTVEFGIDPTYLTMGNGDEFTVMTNEGSDAFYINLNYNAGDYRLRCSIVTDVGTTHMDYMVIPSAYTKVRLEWKAKSGAVDGFAKFYFGDVLQETLSGIDNDTIDVNTLYYGATWGIDAGTYGILYMDDCKWYDQVPIVDVPLGTLSITGLAPAFAPVINFDTQLGTLTITGLAPLVGQETLHIRTASGATLLDSIEDGDGMAFFSSGDEWYSLPLLATKARGSFYGEHIEWSQAGCVANTDYNISDDTIEAGYTSGITADGSGKLTVNKAGLFLINWNMVYECDAANKHIEAGIVINDSSTHSNKGCQHTETKFAGQEETLGGTALLHLRLNDYIQLAIGTTDVGTPTISVQDISLTMVEV